MVVLEVDDALAQAVVELGIEPRIGLDGSTSWAGYVGADWF